MGVWLLALMACLDQFSVSRDASPLQAMRAQGLRADDFPESYSAGVVDRGKMKELGPFGGLLWVDGTRVIADSALAASGLQVVDVTRLRAGERAIVGKWRKGAGAEVAKLLLRAEVIRTYWHIESKICLEAESTKDGVWEGRYSGEHIYFTNERNVGRFAFSVRMEADGTVAVTGR